MEKLTSILENTLKKAGGLELIVQGKTKPPSITNEDKQELFSQLKEHLKFIDRLIIATVVLHFLLFLLATFLVFHYRDDFKAIIALLGGSILSLMVIVRSLVNLVKIRTKIAYIFLTLPNLSPDQAVILIQSIYYEEKK